MTYSVSARLSEVLSRFALLAPSPELQWSQKGLVVEDWEPSGVAAAAANRQAAWVAFVASEKARRRCMLGTILAATRGSTQVKVYIPYKVVAPSLDRTEMA